MKIGSQIDFVENCWHGQIRASNGRDRALWTCSHKHREEHTALGCANNQLGIAEGTMKRIWDRVPRKP